ncbi:hypothetical protein [Phyllobacterium endophyticum]|uniref:hypothetical protein n=1 Tax=Phyllobacterium endophyticum TaxID=1149773 RepID=UPI0011CA9F0B|nr:hypothetical protein [Phyllobacterium endophyticum]TXR46272.1 hypothetical protein FVA77_25940 [Phyllobacterium endophyticum]
MSRRLTKLQYTCEDWNVMQSALFRASKQLQRSQNHEFTDRLARRIMTLFDQGVRDEEVLALAAMEQEELLAKIVALRKNRVTA